MRIQIDGPPVPYARPRVTFRCTYDPRFHEKSKIKKILKSHNLEKLSGPLRINLIFSLQIPKATSKRKREEMLSNKLAPLKKPDLDNLTKFILDCANGILFEDDKQIVQIIASKRYADHPSTILHLTHLYSDLES